MHLRVKRHTFLATGLFWLACSAPNGSTDGPPMGTGGTTTPTTGGTTANGGSTGNGGTANTTGGVTQTSGGSSNGGSSNGGSTQGGVGNGGSGGSSGSFSGGGSSGSTMGGNTSGGNTSGGNNNNNTGGSGGMTSGGNTSKGGTTSGGATSGGMTSKGGATSGGATSGGSSSGGSGPTSCNLTGSPNPGSASFTWYHFSQGSYRDPNSGMYQTACGYRGTANGTTDTVENVQSPNTYFVAIPGQNASNFENNRYCGACVRLTNGGNSVIATVIDECPRDSNPLCVSGHLDVSKTAFDRLGYPVGNPKGTTWSFVPCPVTGNVKIRMKPGNPNEIYIENQILALQSVSMNGQMGRRQSYGAWHWDGNIPQGATLTLTDVAGRTITVTVNSLTAGQNQDTGKQFPACN